MRDQPGLWTKEPRGTSRGCLPKAPAFMAWRSSVRDAVVSASGDPEAAFAWIREVEKEGVTFDTLANSGNFKTLDAKLSAAISLVARGDLGLQLASLKEKYAREDKFLNGRQILYEVYGYYQLRDEDGVVLQFQDLLAVKLHNDDLIKFMRDWDTVISNMKTYQRLMF